MNRSVPTKQIKKALSSADYNLVFKWIERKKIIVDDEFKQIVNDTILKTIFTSKDKNNYDLYYFLFELFDKDVPFIELAMLNLCKRKDYTMIERFVKNYFPQIFLINNITKVPDNIQDLFINNMTNESLCDCLVDVFDDSWNKNNYIKILEKLLKAGANPNFCYKQCGTFPFEIATTIEQAKLFLKYRTKIDKKRLFYQVMYSIIWETAVDVKYAYNKDSVKYHDRQTFILSRVRYEYNDSDNDINDSNYCNDNSESFDMALKFFDENGIQYKRYELTSDKLKKTLSDLNIDISICKKLSHEFVKLNYTFPKEDIHNPGDIIKPGSINYWCWLDHLENSMELLIKKWKIANPTLQSLCIDKIKEIQEMTKDEDADVKMVFERLSL